MEGSLRLRGHDTDTDKAVHHSTLTYWRRRLAGSGSPDRIFEAVAEVLASTGVLAGKTRRELDSTVLDDAVARQDTLTQLISAMRRVGRDVPGGGDLIAATTDPGIFNRL